MTYRVIQWGAGLNGQALIRAVVGHADLQLVGCRVWSAEKDGIDAGTLAGIAPVGVAATTDRNALLALDADVVLFCPHLRPDMAESDRDVLDLLRSGKNVISVSGAHSMPAALGDDYGKQFVNAGLAGGTTLAAAGVNPGFIAERLAPTLTGLCADVTAVRVQETYDCSQGNADILFETMGFGRSLGEWDRDSPTGRMFNHLFHQLVHNMARAMGIELAEVRWTAEVAPAHRDIEMAAGTVHRGTVAAIRQSWEGVPVDPAQVRVSKHTAWVCAPDIPGFPVTSGWDVIVEGTPGIVANVRLSADSEGTHQAEAMVGSAIGVIPEVIAAPPGILLPSIYAPFRKSFG